jgi:hypothetical protein
MYRFGLVVDLSRQLETGLVAATMRNAAFGTPASAKPWSLALAAAMGIVTGVCIATIFHWSHDHSGYTPVELAEHFVPQLLTFATAFALLFVTAAAGWNQRRAKGLSKTPPSYGQGLQ